jgi:small GTP-binding protein
MSLPVFTTVLVGDTTAGKTTLRLRFANGTWAGQGIMTVGVELTVKVLEVGGKTIRAEFWDTPGMERGRRVAITYFRGCHCAVVVFTVKLRKSFAFVNDWVTDALKHSPPDW